MLEPTEVTHRKHIRPLGGNRQPWIGTPLRSEGNGFVIIRCVDPCSAPGLVQGSEYLVRADFVHDQ